MTKALVCLLSLVAVAALLVLAQAPRARAENLPVSADRYGEACKKTGGEFTRNLNSSGVGTVYCLWQPRDRTECKVGGNQVNICMIRCSSNSCIVANPDKHQPNWPLSGGPKKNVAPMDTLMPDTLAPVN